MAWCSRAPMHHEKMDKQIVKNKKKKHSSNLLRSKLDQPLSRLFETKDLVQGGEVHPVHGERPQAFDRTPSACQGTPVDEQHRVFETGFWVVELLYFLAKTPIRQKQKSSMFKWVYYIVYIYMQFFRRREDLWENEPGFWPLPIFSRVLLQMLARNVGHPIQTASKRAAHSSSRTLRQFVLNTTWDERLKSIVLRVMRWDTIVGLFQSETCLYPQAGAILNPWLRRRFIPGSDWTVSGLKAVDGRTTLVRKVRTHCFPVFYLKAGCS